MSTIAYRDGILAGDTRGYAGHNVPIGMKNKIRAIPDGGMVGVTTSTPGLGEAFMDWICDTGEEPSGDPTLAAIVIEPNGEVFYYHDSLLPSGPMEAEFYAIGSGAAAALAAMHMGATAEQAVEIASRIDVWTGTPVRTLELKQKS